MGVMEALLLVSPRTSILKEKCREWHWVRGSGREGMLVDDGEWVVDISRREWKSREE